MSNFLSCLQRRVAESIQLTMKNRRAVGEFYRKLFLAALAATTACTAFQQPAPKVTTVYLVRHGEKSTAIPNDTDPDLSAAGQQRAQALAERLRASGVTAIVTTQLKRTGQTARPLALELGLTPEIVPTGGPAPADSVVAAVLRHSGGKVLVVGHSNTLPAIIEAFGGPRLPNLCDTEYSSMFIMRIGPGRPSLVRQHYGVPDPSADSACIAMQSR